MKLLNQLHYLRGGSNTGYLTYLVFGNFLRVEINVFFGEEFISDFCNIRRLLQV